MENRMSFSKGAGVNEPLPHALWGGAGGVADGCVRAREGRACARGRLVLTRRVEVSLSVERTKTPSAKTPRSSRCSPPCPTAFSAPLSPSHPGTWPPLVRVKCRRLSSFI